ncbi:hypothetical protein DL96DRAFT_1614642 [Flagelloscypha sp. PMI_526]|nr:hypothetical protein DL96DRAFT_1614642 [Flagelloscypha sp. PMI_526]
MAKGNVQPLQRGTCVSMLQKCDGNKPVCRVCFKMNRADQCEYDDKKQKSRTQKLREKLAMLEERIRELESDPRSNESPSEDQNGSGSAFDTSDLDLSAFPDLGGSSFGNAFGPPWFEASTSNNSSPQPPFTSLRNSSSSGSASPDHDSLSAFDFNGFNSATMPYMPRWDPNEPLPFENHRILVDIFIAHRQQCCYDGDVSRFDSNPEYHQEPHPALLNAIYLVACNFAHSPSFSEFEPVFYSRTLHNINDRLLDIVQASCLLAIYLYSNNRALEGYCHAFSAARLAVGLGLHQLKPVDSITSFGDPASAPESTPYPYSSSSERIATFWQVFMIDRCWSVANGLPIALPDGECHLVRIRTPWPTPLNQDVPDLQQPFDDSAVKSSDYMPALRVKAAALYERTFRLSAVTTKNEMYWTEYHAAQQALQRFMAALPGFLGQEAWRMTAPFVDVDLLCIHTLVHVSTIHLQKDHFEQDALLCANSVTALIRQLSEGDYEFLDPILTSCWLSVAKVYIQLDRPEAPQLMIDPFQATPMSQEVAVIVAALKTFRKLVPLAGEYAKKIDEERKKATNAFPLVELGASIAAPVSVW